MGLNPEQSSCSEIVMYAAASFKAAFCFISRLYTIITVNVVEIHE